MKTVLILSVILSVALSIRAATEEGAVADDRAVLPQARFSFCLDGWLSFRGNCYYLGNDPDTWKNAESYCANYGGSLASVHDIWQYNFLQRMVKSGGHTFAWIGGFHFQDDWRWEDGSVFNYHNWETAAPTDQYQCLQLNSQENKGWSNHGCNMRFPFVCEVNPSC